MYWVNSQSIALSLFLFVILYYNTSCKYEKNLHNKDIFNTNNDVKTDFDIITLSRVRCRLFLLITRPRYPVATLWISSTYGFDFVDFKYIKFYQIKQGLNIKLLQVTK